MTVVTKRFHDFFGSSYVAFLGSAASIVSLAWFAYLELHPSPWAIVGVILLPLTFAIFFGVAVYSIKVRQENREFRNFISILHRVNHDYRDALSAVFRIKSVGKDFSEEEYLKFLKELEGKTLKSVCQKIASFFTAFSDAKCIVTVKMLEEQNERFLCKTYHRSEENCERDTWHPYEFEVKSGLNTAFDNALLYAPAKISHFHSPDLTKEKDYRNQRDNWSSIYKCVIVVPIRCIEHSKVGTNKCSDDLGFLAVDTLSTNRLNNTWHVELMASFADQMYNFINLMRGRYALRPRGSE